MTRQELLDKCYEAGKAGKMCSGVTEICDDGTEVTADEQMDAWTQGVNDNSATKKGVKKT
jgi:hypothetical protein